MVGLPDGFARMLLVFGASSNERLNGDSSAFVGAQLHEGDDVLFGLVNPVLCCGESEGLRWVIVCDVALALQLGEGVGEVYDWWREQILVLLRVPSGVAVFQAAVNPVPCVACDRVPWSADQAIGVTASEGVEHSVVGSADRPA